jgi:type II secretory ATPase GspE/PulE/Tfp pilus assembly ATPase PilB-like protein
LRGPVRIAVASFDDIATVLERRLDERTAEAADVAEPGRRSGDDDIDSLRDLASGAPVVRAVNGLLERALELPASVGMTTMLDDAVEKCRAGTTAASEVLRVTSVR